ncbi:MAG: tetratricopeptide repeat protein [Niameybacter sp.]|uniref:tetratricopeptide repeat protein n=1 Tax=Niameybacter sp. TaxID=2033640 RepID=UPI002FC5D739
MKILFVTTDWMKYYVGEGDEEKVVPLCGYNFQNVNGLYYGYGAGLEKINLEKLEGVNEETIEIEDDQVKDVLVVWLAPNRKGETCVIGWYKNATVYSDAMTELTLDSEQFEKTYTIVAASKGSILLPVEERSYVVEGLEAPLAYHMEEAKRAELLSYIHNYAGDCMNLVLKEKELTGVLSINMDYERYFYKADEFLAKDAYAKAIRCFNRAIQEEPNETLGYECKASILLSLKMYDEALELYKKVVALDESNDLAYYCIGLILGLKGMYDDALPYFDQYLERRSQDYHVVAERAYIYFVQGNKAKAEEAIEMAYKNERENPVVTQIYKRIVQK